MSDRGMNDDTARAHLMLDQSLGALKQGGASAVARASAGLVMLLAADS
jgi:hypothetical protein